jgi:hypothetical protein
MTPRLAMTVAMAAAILAGCAGPTASGSPVPATPAPTATPPTETSAPSVTPTGSAQPSPGVVCPSDLPTGLASVGELADPSCYGTTELTIDGWLADADVATYPGETEPSWTNPWVALFAESPTVGEWILDPIAFGGQFLAERISMVARPAADIDFDPLNTWVRVRGHFNDPAASPCRHVQEVDPLDRRDCSQLFVVSMVEPLERDQPECPTASPLTVAEYTTADASCFIGREVTLIGWEDPGEGFGGTGPIYRATLPAELRIAEAQLTSHRWESGDVEPFFFVWTIAGSGVRFDRSDRRVEVTGNLGDPVAKECRAVPEEGFTWSPPHIWAESRCDRIFVVTDVRATD